MFNPNRTNWPLRAKLALVLYAALLAPGASADTPKLESIAVTPSTASISVGQKQSFTATGSFSNGTRHKLGAAIANIAGGYDGTCALLTSGGVDCWGDNEYGQLGDGSTVPSLAPRRVKGIVTATALAFTNFHSCAVLTNGGVRCWGRNDSGQLGNGTYNFTSTPVSVIRLEGRAAGLAVGMLHSCALLTDGSAQCWGFGGLGQLGAGFYGNSPRPVTVDGISTATALSAHVHHSCALLASGAVQCWGYNAQGQLGNGTTSDSSTPVTVKGISSATAIATGAFFSCAVLANGSVQCWGAYPPSNGPQSTTPVTVPGISTAVAIAAGWQHACAALRGGAVQCWGLNGSGQLGDGSVVSTTYPVRVRTIFSPIRLTAGNMHTCALFSGGMMRCWGNNNRGQLGNRRRTDDNPYPVTVVGTPGVMWVSSDPLKATITDRGMATGRAVGNTTITATTAGFINDNAVLTVK